MKKEKPSLELLKQTGNELLYQMFDERFDMFIQCGVNVQHFLALKACVTSSKLN